MWYKYMEVHHVMKPLLATITTLSILFALACAPAAPPPPCDAAGYNAAEVDARPTLRVYVSETWPPKLALYVREAFEGLDVRVIEVGSANIADVSIWPIEPHVTDCAQGAGYYTATIYVDWLCHWAADLTVKVRELLAHFTPLARH